MSVARQRLVTVSTLLRISAELRGKGSLVLDFNALYRDQHRDIGGGMYTRKAYATREAPRRGQG
jgi:hypothetical protein